MAKRTRLVIRAIQVSSFSTCRTATRLQTEGASALERFAPRDRRVVAGRAWKLTFPEVADESGWFLGGWLRLDRTVKVDEMERAAR